MTAEVQEHLQWLRSAVSYANDERCRLALHGIEQEIERLQIAFDGIVTLHDVNLRELEQATERLIETTGKAAEYDAALEALPGTDERLPLFGRIMQLRTEAKERERQLLDTLTVIEAISDPATGVQNEEAWARIHQLAEAAITVPPKEEKS